MHRAPAVTIAPSRLLCPIQSTHSGVRGELDHCAALTPCALRQRATQRRAVPSLRLFLILSFCLSSGPCFSPVSLVLSFVVLCGAVGCDAAACAVSRSVCLAGRPLRPGRSCSLVLGQGTVRIELLSCPPRCACGGTRPRDSPRNGHAACDLIRGLGASMRGKETVEYLATWRVGVSYLYLAANSIATVCLLWIPCVVMNVEISQQAKNFAPMHPGQKSGCRRALLISLSLSVRCSARPPLSATPLDERATQQ